MNILAPPTGISQNYSILTIGREEHITEAVLFWNQQKLYRLPHLLHTRLQEIRKSLNDAKIHLLQLKDVVGRDITPELCERTCKEIQQIAKG